MCISGPLAVFRPAKHAWQCKRNGQNIAALPSFAYNGMVADGAGTFYGATVHGVTNDGAIYQFTP
jgi:hypothetical protein